MKYLLLKHYRGGPAPAVDSAPASRTGPGGRLVPLGEQDRSRWDTGLITEGVAILQATLAHGP